MPYQASESRYQTMRYRPAGRTGLKLPALSLGLWHNFGKYDSLDNMKSLLFTAFDHGICHFDLANNYGPDPGCAEENFGRIMQFDLRKYRDELVISTKAGCEMWEGPYSHLGSRKHLLASLDQSLKRMGLEYVDIFYLHCQDRETPLEESMLALDQAVRQGKALYAAISNHTGETAAKAVSILREKRTPFALLQNSYSMLNRRIEGNGLQQFAVESGSGIIAFKPLEQGILTGKYQQGIPADSRIRRDGRYLREDAITEKNAAAGFPPAGVGRAAGANAGRDGAGLGVRPTRHCQRVDRSLPSRANPAESEHAAQRAFHSGGADADR